MGRFDNIKTAIDTNIKANGNQAITGAVLNSVMTQTVDSVDTQLTELEIYQDTIRLVCDGANFKKTRIALLPNRNYKVTFFSDWESNSYSKVRISHVINEVTIVDFEITATEAVKSEYILKTVVCDNDNIYTINVFGVNGAEVYIKIDDITAEDDINTVSNRVGSLESVVFIPESYSWEMGGINSYNGLNISSDIRIRTVGFYDTKKGVLKSNNPNVEFFLFYYNGDNSLAAVDSGYHDCIKIDETYPKYRILARLKDGIIKASDGVNIVSAFEEDSIIAEISKNIFGKIRTGKDIAIITKDKFEHIAGYISSVSPFVFSTLDSTTSGALLDISKYRGNSVTVTRKKDKSLRYAFLKDSELVNQSVPNFCAGTSLYLGSPDDESLSYTSDIPLDCNYLYVTSVISGVEVVEDILISDSLYSLNIDLQGGCLNDIGAVCGSLNTRESFFNYLHTPNMISVDGIVSIELEDGEEATFFFYSKDGRFLKKTSSLDNKPPQAVYVKIQLHKNSEYSTVKTIKVNSQFEVYEQKKNNGNKSIPIFHSFDVCVPVIESVEKPSETSLINKRHFDNGYIMLPPNYSDNGEPVPLVFFVHGSFGFDFAETDIKSYKPYLTYICNNGYAVADCSGLTDKFKIGEEAISDDDTKLSMVGIACFADFYKFIVKNYNIKTDGVYVFGKSAGGLISSMLGYLQPFKVRAVGGLAPSLSYLGAESRNINPGPFAFNMKQFGVTDTFNPCWAWTDEDHQKIYNNISKLAPYDPFIHSSSLDGLEITKEMYKYSWSNMDQSSIWDIVNKAKKSQPFPYKIWGAEDDANTPFVIWLMWQKMVNNNNEICYLRQMPTGTGGHHAVDTSELAVKVSKKPRYGDEVEIPIAYAELVEWFDRW